MKLLSLHTDYGVEFVLGGVDPMQKPQEDAVEGLKPAAKVHRVTEIKYFETSQVYGKVLHEPCYIVETTDVDTRYVVPARKVELIILDMEKANVAGKAIKSLGDTE